ncbi:hypothetical protein SUGI_0905600 [Cryptomeria japonica]|nr:hypothetical protein SUGI_0905600 [Cryptomeria japonica]
MRWWMDNEKVSCGVEVRNLRDLARLFPFHSLFFLAGIDEKDGQQLIVVETQIRHLKVIPRQTPYFPV